MSLKVIINPASHSSLGDPARFWPALARWKVIGVVLPTSRHAPLTGWLNAKETGCAAEVAGTVVLRGFNAIQGLVRPGHLTPEVYELFVLARGTRTSTPASLVAREALWDAVTSALSAIRDDLAGLGVEATPYRGLGVLSDDDIFECAIVIGDPQRLAGLLGVSYVPGSWSK